MATKKGIAITIAVLAGITAASSIVWFLPQQENSSLVISDYRNELDSIHDRQSAIMYEIENNLKNMISGTVSPDDFITSAQVSSSQINSLLTEIIESKPPREWQEPYLEYGESLKSYNNYLTETIVLANKIKQNDSNSDLKVELTKIDEIRNESESFALKSNETRP